MLMIVFHIPITILITYFIKEEEQKRQEKEYCSVVKKVKKENVTKNNIGEIMLCQIPGISSASALAIMDKHKTLPALMDAIKHHPTTCLDDVYTTDGNGKQRRLAKNLVRKIVEYLS